MKRSTELKNVNENLWVILKMIYVLTITGVLPIIVGILDIMRGDILLGVSLLIMGVSFSIALTYKPNQKIA